MATETKREKTKICALNLDADLIKYLSERFDVYNGTVGNMIDVAQINKSGLRLLSTLDVPNNILEYEVFIEDMYLPSIITYEKEKHCRANNTGNSEYYIISRPPQTVVNLYPVGSSILDSKIKDGRTRPVIKIAFQAEYEEITYHIKNIYDYYSGEDVKHNNYEHLEYFPGKAFEGGSVKLVDNKLSKSLFESLLNDITYFQTYVPPTVWKDEERIIDKHFLPLLENKQGACISYIWYSENDITVILPQTSKKKELLESLFNNVLFRFFSEYFPEVEESAWIKNADYFLPKHRELLNEQEAITAKYEADMKAVQQQIDENNEKYGFLHTILTATGDELVQAMIKYLQWLGFGNVIDKDTTQEEGSPLEEDIQIDFGKEGLLVIEVKGIGGTSTDAQCSQIHKIVYRRAKERDTFDVHGLYIANNELHKEPLKRTRPPFTAEQITDAQNDERGLAYTWQFFNLFFAIEDGIITKEEARNALFEKGLISFNPTVIEIGVPYKYFQEHTVACLEVGEAVINEGDFFFYKETDRWNKVKILSIQEGKNQVKTATSGKFGFGLEHRVPNNVPLYIKQA